MRDEQDIREDLVRVEAEREELLNELMVAEIAALAKERPLRYEAAGTLKDGKVTWVQRRERKPIY